MKRNAARQAEQGDVADQRAGFAAQSARCSGRRLVAGPLLGVWVVKARGKDGNSVLAVCRVIARS